MAKTPHSYAKRQREIEKKRKADEKRARKLNKGKPAVDEDGEVVADPTEGQPVDGDPVAVVPTEGQPVDDDPVAVLQTAEPPAN
ncbi:MAG: hypothetical protein ACU85U_09700 [Gammaproteobacteria bacterium]|jgi:hypothetical protein